ncbi:MAG: aminopeptidase P family protein [SAR324 cluster bacterium]|nr:aminopeptidase P family protein [SAR324 cluster bacterium]
MSDSPSHDPAQHLAALRGLMVEHKLDVYLVPSADEHQNEYLPDHKKRREAISGFTGSAGDVAVCAAEAHLFVDSRYHIQAAQEVSGQEIKVHKLGLAGEQHLYEWLNTLEAGQGALRVGYDPFVITLDERRRLAKALLHEDSELCPLTGNLVDRAWDGVPAFSPAPAFSLPDDITGEDVAHKLGRLREKLEEAGVGALVLSKLDEAAWLTNLRGRDIPYNPVFEAFMVVTRDSATCFSNTEIPEAARAALESLVDFQPYGAFPQALQTLGKQLKSRDESLWLDGASASEGLALLAKDARLHRATPNPVKAMKAIKNPVEIERMREGHLKSGCAKVRAFSRLSSLLGEGTPVSERGFADLLQEEYAREDGYSDLSFTTISAFGANGAIVHYATPDPRQLLEPGGLLLVDSGVQILGATTDDTRTVAIGSPDDLQRERYTDVLRAHIRLATQIFPEGTNGQMLDAITRSLLWNAGADYGHGTGHGVGAYLNVHEGPQNISPRGTVPLEPGMIVSNEPGYYHAGRGGIRLENLMVVEEMLGLPAHPSGKRWLRFIPLTMIPFDRNLIAGTRLNPDERAWIDDYHRLVAETLAPLLEEPDQQWLAEACRPLS